jgi:hypothetical protein
MALSAAAIAAVAPGVAGSPLAVRFARSFFMAATSCVTVPMSEFSVLRSMLTMEASCLRMVASILTVDTL